MKTEALQELYSLAAKRDEKIDGLQQLLMTLAVAGLSIATPLLAATGSKGFLGASIKAALLSATLGILSSAIRLYFAVRASKRIVEARCAQIVSGLPGEPITVNPRWHERIAEGAAFFFYACALLLLLASAMLS